MTLAQKAGLAAALVVIIALGSHVTRWSGIDGLMIPVVVLGAAGFLLTVGVRRAGGSGGAYRTVHGHGATRQIVAEHEAGHAAVVRHIGGSNIRAVARDNGSGWTSFRPPDYMTPAESIAVSLGGALAEGVSIDSRQCGGDKALIDQDLRRVGWFQQGATMRKAHQIAARGLRQQSGFARSTSRKLARSGRMSAW